MTTVKGKNNKRNLNKCILSRLKEMFDDKSVYIKKYLRKNKEHYVHVKCDDKRRFDFESHGFQRIDSNVWLDNVNYERSVYIIEKQQPTLMAMSAASIELQLNVSVFMMECVQPK
ncbi:hypothetical protein ManeNPV_00099 [Malacosoma neustria nucleopolyhedrovirus]|uniref:hypothetical protein n=1 Tax=Malacosoma neustria nuclear polyhedrosis virus TaxID=38012 RepID=UPI000E35FBA6|nr:hypothetical protein ManeNPV_00099 [Malacosoma neustria nucleopolyhedrovirus]AUF81625.1 hypothetical protein ManeNPV_00099 [Malacosoma neustria nucleopolyhedrovirus]